MTERLDGLKGLTVKCPHCTKEILVELDWRGDKGQCPSCGAWLVLPADVILELRDRRRAIAQAEKEGRAREREEEKARAVQEAREAKARKVAAWEAEARAAREAQEREAARARAERAAREAAHPEELRAVLAQVSRSEPHQGGGETAARKTRSDATASWDGAVLTICGIGMWFFAIGNLAQNASPGTEPNLELYHDIIAIMLFCGGLTVLGLGACLRALRRIQRAIERR